MKVVFNGATEPQINWGGNDDPNSLLTVGEVYEVETRNVHSWHTKITIKGVKGRFNDASFTYLENPDMPRPSDTINET